MLWVVVVLVAFVWTLLESMVFLPVVLQVLVACVVVFLVAFVLTLLESMVFGA